MALSTRGAGAQPSKLASPLPPRTRLRKTTGAQPAQKINTNPSAYPRTDPANALRVLLKLLTSLPSRIGGCQYKLTQAEHALSLHLVSILDPYVYHGVRALAPNPATSAPTASYFGFVDQPTEIIDAILFHVDARKDLLNIGLVCKRLNEVVFPRHFDYRVIRCKVSSISVWNHLILHRSLARNVRKVEIMDERSPTGAMLVPRGILERDTDLESTDDELTMHAKQERFLAKALIRMTGLKEFKWSCNHSPLSIAHVWPTLMIRAANLKSLNICDNMVFSPRPESEGSDSESDVGEDQVTENQNKSLMSGVPAIALREMENVTFRSTSHIYGASNNPDLGRVVAMLHQCANLKELDITYVAPRSLVGTVGHGSSSRARPLADEFLMYGSWSKLTTLTLSNLRCGSYEPLASFLAAHPLLEVLHLDISVHMSNASSHLSLIPGTLPRLRDVKASKNIINAILECPNDAHRPLESLKGFKLSGTHPGTSTTSSKTVSDATFLLNLRQYATSVRKIELTGWHDMEDIKKLATCVPNVQHLDIGRRFGAAASRVSGNADKGSAVGPATNIIEWTEFLATLPELISMHGVKFFYEVSSAVVSNTSSWAGAGGANAREGGGGGGGATSSSKALANMSMMERSRMRKNDEIAGVLTWKCPKLRRVDHWDDSGSRVIVLLRESVDESARDGSARWEVRRMR